MVNPMGGLVGSEKFLPTLAVVQEWFERQGPSPAAQLMIANAEQTLREREETEKWKQNRGARADRVQKAREMQAKLRHSIEQSRGAQ